MEALIKQYYCLLSRVGFTVAITAITVLATMPLTEVPLADWNDKIQHIFAFLVLSFLIDGSHPSSPFNWKKAAILLGYGFILEVLQKQTGYRFFSVADMVADAAGIALYAFTIPIFKRTPLLRWRWELKEPS